MDWRGDEIYFSPEQLAASPETIGPASDIYSVGAVLYKMLTGRAPSAAIDADGSVKPPEVTRKLTPKLRDVVVKALSPKSEDRYETAEEMHAALEDADRSLAGDDGYDVFISYRVESDNDLAVKLHKAFSAMRVGRENRLARVFLDAVCLQDGGDWEVSFQWKNPDFLLKHPDFPLKNVDFIIKQADFVDALCVSSVCIPVLSNGALTPLKATHKSDNDKVDNVLLEYTLLRRRFLHNKSHIYHAWV